MSCRKCDFDMCAACSGTASSVAATSAQTANACQPTSGAHPQCPKRHLLKPRSVGDHGRSCDDCGASFAVGASALSCAACDFDLCNTCGHGDASSSNIAANHRDDAVETSVVTMLDIQPRKMWGWGGLADRDYSGYCGETSIQTAGLFFGQYVSQELVRYAGGNREVLVDVNAHAAAEAVLLRIDRWDIDGRARPQSDAFLAWAQVRSHEGASY
jgi:hypothetical protein